MKIAGCWSRFLMPSRRAALMPSTATRSPRRRMPGVGQSSGDQLRPHGRPQARGRGTHRKLDVRLALGIVDRHRAHELAAHVHLAEGARLRDAVQALHAGLGIPRDHVHGGTAGSLGRGHRGHDHVGRRDLVEPADDLVAGGLRQAHGRHQRSNPDHRAEHGQADPRRARDQPGGRLREEVAQLHARLRQLPRRRPPVGRPGGQLPEPADPLCEPPDHAVTAVRSRPRSGRRGARAPPHPRRE